MYDLVVVDIKFDESSYEKVVALFMEQDDEFSMITHLKIEIARTETGTSIKYCHHTQEIQNDDVRPFTIDDVMSSNQALTEIERWKLKMSLDGHLTYLKHANGKFMTSISLVDLFYASTIYHFGMNAMYYLKNNYFDKASNTMFDRFHNTYLKLQPQPLVLKNGVKAGDLVMIKTLKAQNRTDLQSLAQHFSASFGEIGTFLSGDLIRNGSQNKKEIVIQSLSQRGVQLAIRPKYLCKITKIYIHKIEGEVPSYFLNKWEPESNQILYLPYYWKAETNSSVFALNDFQNLVFAINNQGKQNVIIEHVFVSFQMLMNTRDNFVQDNFDSLAFCMDRINWPRVMTIVYNLKQNSISKEKTFFEGIEKLFNAHYEKMKSAKTKILDLSSMSAITSRFQTALRDKIKKDLRRAPKKSLVFYTTLFDEISKETRRWQSQLHPDYWKQLIQKDMTLRQLETIYRVSVIQNYLKANRIGKDLHVIYYGDGATDNLHDLTSSLAEKINQEWNINDLNAAHVIANKIIV